MDYLILPQSPGFIDSEALSADTVGEAWDVAIEWSKQLGGMKVGIYEKYFVYVSEEAPEVKKFRHLTYAQSN